MEDEIRREYALLLKSLHAKRDTDLRHSRDAIAILTDVIDQTMLTRQILQLLLDAANKVDHPIPL